MRFARVARYWALVQLTGAIFRGFVPVQSWALASITSVFAALEVSLAHIPVTGLLLDIAGALVLGISVTRKKAQDVYEEAPNVISGGTPSSTYTEPGGLALSLLGEVPEAQVGLLLLVLGFVGQALGAIFDLGSLTTSGERVAVVPLVLVITGLVYAVGWRWFVPRQKRRGIQAYTQRASDDVRNR
jgi:hypothetical protein